MTYTLLIDCIDRKGLVHSITGVLLQHDLNIVKQGEFVSDDLHFFMRTVFSGAFDTETLTRDLGHVLPDNTKIQLSPRSPKSIVICVTKEAHCLGDLLIRHTYGDLNARIAAVIGNRTRLSELVSRFDIPFHHVSADGISREDHEEEVLKLVRSYQPDYLVLAKYMRLLTPRFTAQFPNRMINIHHSFLPAFVGARPYRQAFKRGVKIIGATAHFVTDQLDEGPIIAQDVVRIDHSKSVRDMTRSGQNVETSVLADALRLVFEDRVFVHGNRTIIFD